jgi:uncharacterized protein DUF3800
MHLVYFDETGNSGNNLDEVAQPIFVLGALIVPEQVWMPLEADLLAAVERHCPSPRPEEFEIKASELHNPRGYFRDLPMALRFALRAELFAIARKHGLRFVYRAIEKRRYKKWMVQSFGGGVVINPHVAAFPLIARVVDDYLQNSPGSPLGVLIFDENRDVVTDVEKSHRLLRSQEGVLKLKQIIEKAFFIDSRSSLPLQLCDLCVYAARRKEELRTGFPVKPYNQDCVPLVEPLIHRGEEKFPDVIAWLAEQKKRSGQGHSRGPGLGPNRSGR